MVRAVDADESIAEAIGEGNSPYSTPNMNPNASFHRCIPYLPVLNTRRALSLETTQSELMSYRRR